MSGRDPASWGYLDTRKVVDGSYKLRDVNMCSRLWSFVSHSSQLFLDSSWRPNKQVIELQKSNSMCTVEESRIGNVPIALPQHSAQAQVYV